MPINPAIALQVKSPEPIDLLGTYGKFSAIQAAQTQNALAQMQMQEYGRARSEEDAIRNRLIGGGKLDDPDMQNLLLSSKTGREILKSETDRRRAALQADKDASDLIDKSMARYRDFAGFVKSKDDAIQLLQTAIADPRMKDSPLTKIPFDQQVNHIPDDPKGLDDWLKMFSLGTTKFDELNKPTTQVIDQSGQRQVIQLPGLGGAPTTVGTYADVPLPAGVEAQKSRIAKAGASNINVGEKKYGERFGGLIAEADAAKLAAAEKAPEAAATADRVMDLIGTGKVITGTGANARLQIAKALNLAGGTDSEKIRNTEVLISSLAETTLGAIKSSNLGAGQGFTNADRDFLEKAKAGQLSYDSKSLAELARLSRLAAEKSAESWNTRVKQIPAAALEGTGISTEPVIVPPRKTSSVMNIPAGAINALKAGQGTPEQFDAVFGAGSAARVLGKGK